MIALADAVMPIIRLLVAARGDGDEQPDDRHHGVGQRDHLPVPGRNRSLRRGTCRRRRLSRRLGWLADSTPDRPARPADLVRAGPHLHGLRDDPQGAAPVNASRSTPTTACAAGLAGTTPDLDRAIARLLAFGTYL